MRNTYVIIVLVFVLQFIGVGNALSSENSFLKSDGFVGITFDNDVFLKTDYYYTNGIDINILSSKFHFGFLKLFTLKFSGFTAKQYSFSLSQGMYTPEKTSTSEIVYNDRPYAGTLTSGFKEHVYFRRSKVESEFEFGFLGNIAGSGTAQNIIHKIIDNDSIGGWKNQINNDLIVNLNYSFIHQLFNTNFTDLSGVADLRIGTLHTDFSGSLNLRIGRRRNQFDIFGPVNDQNNHNRWQLYTFWGVTSRFVLYNATLNGGIFNPTSRLYALNSNEIEQLILEYRAGITGSLGPITIQLLALTTTPEFNKGKKHTWMGISVFYTF